jgi:uncharacterized membrane protein YqgA involved in biofilm formation
MLGVLVNVAAIIIGSLIGLLAGRGIPKRFSKAVMTAIGLSIIYVGVSGALEAENIIVLVLSMMLGVTTGTALKLEDRLNSLGQKLEMRFAPGSGGGGKSDAGKSTFAQGFVSASLLFCVGAMAIVGSINSGLLGDHSIIYAKSTIDFVSSIMLAVSFGIGVMFSAVSVFVYQGILVLLAGLLRPILYDPALLAELTGVGSLIIVALGLNIIGVTKIKIADFLPAMVFVPILFRLYEMIL